MPSSEMCIKEGLPCSRQAAPSLSDFSPCSMPPTLFFVLFLPWCRVPWSSCGSEAIFLFSPGCLVAVHNGSARLLTMQKKLEAPSFKEVEVVRKFEATSNRNHVNYASVNAQHYIPSERSTWKESASIRPQCKSNTRCVFVAPLEPTEGAASP